MGVVNVKPAVVYARKSKGTDFGSQIFMCEQFAKAEGYSIVEKYLDEDISRVGFKHREHYQRLLEDIRSGALSGHVVLVRDQDRLTGEPAEQAEWNLATAVAKVKTFDCTTGRAIQDDYFTDMEAAKAKEEVRQTSKRWIARWAERDANGVPPYSPTRPYGYETRYAAVIPDERDWLLKVKDKILAGAKLLAIAKWLNENGVKTSTGKSWTQSTLSRMVRRWEYAGWRRARDGSPLAKGQWEGIWTYDEHEQILAILNNNSPFSQDNARKHLLSGIVVCTTCGSKLRVATPKNNYTVYRCQEITCGHKVSCGLSAVNDYVIRRVYEELRKFPAPPESEDTTDAEIQALRDERAETVKARKEGVVSLQDMAELVADIDDKINKLQRNRPVPMPVDSAADFLNADTDKKRQAIRRLYPVIGLKRGKPGEKFTPVRLEFPDDV